MMLAIMSVSADDHVDGAKVVGLAEWAEKRQASQPSAEAFVSSVEGEPFRFFKGPGSTPDLPWASLSDLARLCGFGEKRTFELVASCAKLLAPHGCISTVATDSDGEIFIVPLLVAVGLLLREEQDVEAFVEGAREAMNASMAGMSETERFQHLIVASRSALEAPAQDGETDRA